MTERGMGPMCGSIGVVGAGIMGCGIAEVAARAGRDVLVCDVDQESCSSGFGRIRASLDRAVARDKLAADERDHVLSRITFTTVLEEFEDREFVIEAIVEDEEAKTKVFNTLDAVVVSREAVLATNTSSIPIMKLAMATSRPDAVVGLHFFNPVPVLSLVEIVPSLLTSDTTVDVAERLATEVFGKKVIRSQDRAGFIVNALLMPYVLSAVRMVESGFATPIDIDQGMVEGCAHPMGPLALADLIGLDTTMAVSASLYEEFKEPLFAAPPLLSRMVEAGLLGRKSGRGFYEYRP